MLDTSFTKKNDASLLLSNQERETVNDLSTTLEPLTAVTTYMSKEKSVSYSVVYPVVCGLLNKSLKVTSEDNSVVRKVKESIAMELNKHYLPTDVNTAKTTPVIASLLDPRYKKLLFLNPDQCKTAESTLDAMLDEMPLKMAQTRTDEPSAKRSRVECALDFLDFTSPEKRGSDDDELKSYLCEKTSSDNTLTWWKERESKYPRISHIAKRVLAIPATSVPSERIFSAAGLLVNKLRTRLSCDLVDNIIFLNKNKFPLCSE